MAGITRTSLGGWIQEVGTTSRTSLTGFEQEVVQGGPIIPVQILNINWAGIATVIQAYWLAPSDVKLGVVYGPNGNDYTGTLVGGAGGVQYRPNLNGL